MIIEAILKINPNAKATVKGTDIDTCEIEWHENTTPISKEDIKAQIPIVEAEIEQKKLDKEQANQSAIDKLKALGLTDAEIEAFRGK
jgi:hypothetical protein